jgi:alpha-glucosidase
LPVTWDQTLVLPGSEIGKLAAFARRKGNDWYVAVINGADEAAIINLKASFIPNRKIIKATVIRDADQDKGFLVEEQVDLATRSGTKFTIKANGGLLIRIKN